MSNDGIVITSPGSRKGSSSTASSYSNSSTLTGHLSPPSTGTSECGSSDTLLDSGNEDESPLVEQSTSKSQNNSSALNLRTRSANASAFDDNRQRGTLKESLLLGKDSNGAVDTWNLTLVKSELVKSELPHNQSTPERTFMPPENHPDEFPRFFIEKDCQGQFASDGGIVFNRKQKKKKSRKGRSSDQNDGAESRHVGDDTSDDLERSTEESFNDSVDNAIGDKVEQGTLLLVLKEFRHVLE